MQSVVTQEDFLRRSRNLVGGSAAKPLATVWGSLFSLQTRKCGKHRLNARMTAKQGPRMCRRSSADFWGPAFVDPLARGKTSSHSPRNLSDMVGQQGTEVSSKLIQTSSWWPKFLGHIGNGSPERLHLAKRRFGSQKSGKQDFKKWLKYNVLGP